MTTEALKVGKLIHAAAIYANGKWCYLFLREDAKRHFTWHEEQENGTNEITTPISAPSIEEAMHLASKHWKNNSFKTIHCGFRYTLPERDEHGINAFFYQMVASYSSGNGIYYDESIGNNCFVQNASEEALNLWKSQNRLA
jgi:hypothetical protein